MQRLHWISILILCLFLLSFGVKRILGLQLSTSQVLQIVTSTKQTPCRHLITPTSLVPRYHLKIMVLEGGTET